MLVTAAAGTGIGFATAKRCAEEGARVVISDSHERRLGEAAEELAPIIGERPPTRRLRRHATRPRCSACVAGAIAELGRLDVLVNNAGLGGYAPPRRHDRRAVARGARRHAQRHLPLTRAALPPHARRAARGVIVNNASVLGWRAQAGQAHYAAAKAGVMALTRCAAIEAAAGRRARQRGRAEPRDAPVPREGARRQGLLDELETREAFGRAAEPWEVANVIVFLASDYSSYMTGEVVSVSSQHP